MSTLKELQDTFQRSVLTDDDRILEHVKDTSKEQRSVLFGVYRHAYSARLAEILQGEFPVLYAYLGDDLFSAFGHEYVKAHPSHFRSARWFGLALPEFLTKSEKGKAHAELAEIAALENALSDAFDAEDAAPVVMGDLAAFAPEEFPQLCFRPHPSTRRLDLRTNALDIWMALSAEEDCPPPQVLPEPLPILVWRQDSTSRVRSLSAEESMLWHEAAKGVRFGVLCELLATFSGDDGADMRAAGYLKGWLDTEALAGIGVQD